MMKTVNVVAAVIKKENKIFITQRGYGEFKDLWEFPGGKIELHEDPKDALIREIKEELNASINVDKYLLTVEHDYSTFHLSMQVYLCHLLNPHIELLEHENSMWVELNNIDKSIFLEADIKVIDELLSLNL